MYTVGCGIMVLSVSFEMLRAMDELRKPSHPQRG